MKKPIRILIACSALLLFTIAAIAEQKNKPITDEINRLKETGAPVPTELLDKAAAMFNEAQSAPSIPAAHNLMDGGSDSTNATNISTNPFLDTGSTVGKGNNALLSPCLSGGADTAEDAWYRLYTPSPITLTTWTTCASSGPPSYDTRMGIYDDNLTILACNDDAPGCGSPYYQSRITNISLNPGTYFIVVDGYNGNEGPYEFNASWIIDAGGCSSGSDYTNADSITSMPFTDAGTTVDACHNLLLGCELGPGGSAPDYWYTVYLDTFVLMDVWTTCEPAGIDTRIAILDSTRAVIYCNDDDPGCVHDKSLIEDAFLEAGQYYIVVEGAGDTEGTYTINVDTTHTDLSAGLILAPDIIVRESDLYDNDIDTTLEAGRTHLRLSNGTANVGEGKLYLYGTGVDNGDGTESVIQRVWRSNGTTYDRTAGIFLFHANHNHIHVEDWCEYSLREVLPNDGVGDVVAKSAKTSFCILDLAVYDAGLPYFNPVGEFFSCGSTTQGLSVGWVDVYSKSLSGQNIDVTDVPDGTYWLESHADPLNRVLELDETNNITRIKVTLGSGPAISPDSYEPNGSTAAVDSRPPGGPNSPNLGPCDPNRVITNLTVHVAQNDDYFKFYSNHGGAPGDFVSITFDSTAGDLNLCLLDSSGTAVDSSVTSNGVETVSLNGRPEGWYYALIKGAGGSLSPGYSLTVDPPVNQAPIDSVVDPPPGTSYAIHGQDTYSVTWTSSDPEGDETWVKVYANTSPTIDGNEILLSVSGYVDAELGFFVVNTAYLAFDTYWFYVEITDGGTTTGDWSSGTLKLLDGTTSAGGDRTPSIVNSRLYTPVPNPFQSHTSLRLDLEQDAFVSWRIYDVRGRVVREIPAGSLTRGIHNRVWDGRDRDGRRVASGIYFQSVVGRDIVLTGKLVVLR